jgi:hypothetical protein
MGAGTADHVSSLSTGSAPLFVFGSLMDSDLLSVVLNRPAHHLSRQQALLPGFRRHRVADEAFPMLIPHASLSVPLPAEPVPGHLLDGLIAEDVQRLIYFEGPGYALTAVSVLAPAGCDDAGDRRRPISAQTFLATEQLTDSGAPWDLFHWQRTEKPLALHIADELMRFFGHIPSEDIEGAEWDALKDRALFRLRQGEELRCSADL